MASALDDLPDDVATLKAMLLAERAQSERLRHLLAQLRRAQFGRKSEKGGVDQLNLGLEDIETAVAAEEAKLEKSDTNLGRSNAQKRRTNRGSPPQWRGRSAAVRHRSRLSRAGLHCGKPRSRFGGTQQGRVAAVGRVGHAARPGQAAGCDDLLPELEHPRKRDIIGLRKVILGADLTIAEGIKWNAPSFRTTGYFATINLRAKAGVEVILHFGAKKNDISKTGVDMPDPSKLLSWLAKDRARVAFKNASDI